jgi:hypothetical protein
MATLLAIAPHRAAGRWLLAGVGLLYLTLSLATAAGIARRAGAAAFLPGLLALPVDHIAYGLGTLAGLLWVPFARRRGPRPCPPAHAS